MRKLTKRSQMLIYAVSGMGVNMLNLMMGSYLCSALLTGGFGAEAIPFQTFEGKNLVVAAVWATFVLVAKIIDGVIDIPMASFTDNLRTKWGRRRPSILIGLVLTVAAYLLFALVTPNVSGATIGNTIYFGIVLCVFYSFYTLTMVTYYATFTEIVDNEPDRTFMSNVKSVCDIFYFIIGYVLVRMLLNGINVRYVALIVLPLAATMLIPLFMIKENKDELGNVEKVKSVNLFQSLGHTFRNKTYVLWMCVYALMTFGVQLFLGGINEYFSFVKLNMMVVMATSFAPVPFTLILYNIILRKKGFGFAFRYVLLLFGLGMFSMFFVGKFIAPGLPKTILSVVCGLICSMAVGSLFAVAYSVPSQLAAEEEARTGISNSAMYFAVQGLFSGVASGLATGVVLVALKEASEPNKVGGQAMSYMTLVCALAMFVAFAGTYILPKSLAMMGKKDQTDSQK